MLIPMAQRASAFKGAHQGGQQQSASDEAAATSAPHHGPASSRGSIPPRHIPATSMSHLSGGPSPSSGAQTSPPLPSFAQLVSVASSAEQAASAIISSAKAAAASKRRKTQDGSFSSGFSATESNNGGSTSGEADDTELERLENDKERKRKLRLLKNRQSAALSRQRKKEYIGNLERRLDDLNNENTEYQSRLTSLATQHWEAQHVIDDLQRQVTGLKEENERLRVAATLTAYASTGLFANLPSAAALGQLTESQLAAAGLTSSSGASSVSSGSPSTLSGNTASNSSSTHGSGSATPTSLFNNNTSAVSGHALNTAIAAAASHPAPTHAVPPTSSS